MKYLKTGVAMLCCVFAFVLFGCENQNISSLSTPQNLKIENGIIMFDLVSDADYYAISINDKVFMVDSRYNSNVEIIDSVVRYNANKILTYGKSYTIKVKARGNDKYDSHYCNSVEYYHSISLQTPKNLSVNSSTLTWDGVDDASCYMLKIYYSTADKTEELRCDVCFCDLSSMLAKFGTGKYLLSVKAVRVGVDPAESSYSEQLEYLHYYQLETPTINNVYMFNNNLFMDATLDESANQITLSCGEDNVSIMLNGGNQNVTRTDENLKINLTGVFGANKFSALKKYVFTLQAKYQTVATNYLKNSLVSEQFIFNKTEKLNSPTIELTYKTDLNCYVLTWQTVENAVGYKLVVDSTEYIVEQGVTQFLINDGFASVKLQALGAGNYLNSDFSFVSE